MNTTRRWSAALVAMSLSGWLALSGCTTGEPSGSDDTSEDLNGAYAELMSGASWRDILVKFGINKENKSRSGKIEGVRAEASGAVGVAMFNLDMGGVSEPFVLDDGTYAVVKLEGIKEAFQPGLKELAEDVGKRMKQAREEENFQALLAKWKGDLVIETYPENLADLKSWSELTSPPVPENLVPRN